MQPGGPSAPGSLYLDSSGKAPTEFWSEELEKAGEGRVRGSSEIRSCARPRPQPLGWGLPVPPQEKAKCKAACLPGPERLQPAAAGLLSTTVEAGGSKVFCSQAASARNSPGGRPLPSNTSPAAPPLLPKFWSSCWPGRDVTGEGQSTGLPRMSSRMPSLLLKHCQQGKMETLGQVENQVFPGSWHVATVRSRGKECRPLG